MGVSEIGNTRSEWLSWWGRCWTSRFGPLVYSVGPIRRRHCDFRTFGSPFSIQTRFLPWQMTPKNQEIFETCPLWASKSFSKHMSNICFWVPDVQLQGENSIGCLALGIEKHAHFQAFLGGLAPTAPDRIMEKKRFNRQAPPVYDRKVTNFFSHNYCFHNYFFFHNSVGDCMSIDSQFECILRGNIEL